MISHVMLFVGAYLPGFKGGGPIKTVANMVTMLSADYNFQIITADRDLGSSEPYECVSVDNWNKINDTPIFYVSQGFFGLLKIAREIRRFSGEIIHINGFFSGRFSIFPVLTARIVRPDCQIILAPRGEFSVGALSIKKVKKSIFIRLVKIFGIYQNIIWHASTVYEKEDIVRVMGGSVEIRIATDLAISDPIGIDIPEKASPIKFVFVSRISRKKNLLGALELLQRLAVPACYDIYGPIEDVSYWSTCQKIVQSMPQHIKVSYCGELQPDQVINAISRYDAFLFPTLGENYGHVIAEALYAGLPLIISDTTPWRDLESKGLGWDIPLDNPDRFIQCIEHCHQMPAEEYKAWRKKIQAWALENISNQAAIEENRQLFMNL